MSRVLIVDALASNQRLYSIYLNGHQPEYVSTPLDIASYIQHFGYPDVLIAHIDALCPESFAEMGPLRQYLDHRFVVLTDSILYARHRIGQEPEYTFNLDNLNDLGNFVDSLISNPIPVL